MEIIELAETDSTNNWLNGRAAGLPSMTLVTARRQSAGRGQRGNSWESAPERNLTVSLLWKPVDFPASRQFAISEAVALAVVDTLEDSGIRASVKWPNDIYVGDDKISGILIEHAVAGRNVMHSVCGIGLNVNQREFVSDAPNPVSMLQLLGREMPLEEVLENLCLHLEQRLACVGEAQGAPVLHAEYMTRLWRGDGRFHPFALPDGERFMAAITAVAPDGYLHLLRDDATPLRFAFKEVVFLPRE